jgi:hypothetical protein
MLIKLTDYGADVFGSTCTTLVVNPNSNLRAYAETNGIQINYNKNGSSEIFLRVKDQKQKADLLRMLDLASSYTEYDLRRKYPELFL